MSRLGTGILGTHQHANAGTSRDAGTVEEAGGVRQVAKLARARGGEYIVIRDGVFHPGSTLYRVFLGGVELGRQASMPGLGDCERIEREKGRDRVAGPIKQALYHGRDPRASGRKGAPK